MSNNWISSFLIAPLQYITEFIATFREDLGLIGQLIFSLEFLQIKLRDLSKK